MARHLLFAIVLLMTTMPFLTSGWNDDSLPVIPLPKTQVQLICEFDIRPKFNVVDVFNEFYQDYLPGISDTQLQTSLQISGMDDIPAHKWYYPYCDLESKQVLATLEVCGFAQFEQGNYTKKLVDELLLEAERPLSLQEYFQHHACENITSWRSHLQEKWDANAEQQCGKNDVELEHSTYFLCGGADQLYYDEEEPDGGFLILGMVVGIVMVLMIVGELQQYENRGRPRRATASRRQEDARTSTYEFEMV